MISLLLIFIIPLIAILQLFELQSFGSQLSGFNLIFLIQPLAVCVVLTTVFQITNCYIFRQSMNHGYNSFYIPLIFFALGCVLPVSDQPTIMINNVFSFESIKTIVHSTAVYSLMIIAPLALMEIIITSLFNKYNIKTIFINLSTLRLFGVICVSYIILLRT